MGQLFSKRKNKKNKKYKQLDFADQKQIANPSKPIIIEDRFETWAALQQGLREAGLESSELIFAVDVTKSNTWNGNKCYDGKSLHHPFPGSDVKQQYQAVKVVNPYTFVMNAVAKTLAAFDDDQQIPAYYFGDSVTNEKSVASFFMKDGAGHGIESVIDAYSQVMPHLQFSGGTSFAPAIEKAMEIVRSTGKYHILVILTDGQVDNMERERKAVAKASELPLSICILGIGDSMFENMHELDNGDYGRKFDNLQFVDVKQVLGPKWCQRIHEPLAEREALDLATAVLMEIPEQFKAIKKLNLLQHGAGEEPGIATYQ